MLLRLIVVSLFALLLLPATSSAKKLSDKGVAKSAISTQGYYYNVASKATLSQETKDIINQNKLCLEQMSKINSSVFALYINNNYFAVSRDQRKLLLQGKKQLLARGQLLLRKAKRSNGKQIARSLLAHGNFSTFYLQSYRVDICLLKNRIEELGGYTDSNINQAYLEAIGSQPGLATWLETVDQRANRLLSSIGVGAEIIASLGYSTQKYSLPLPLVLPSD